MKKLTTLSAVLLSVGVMAAAPADLPADGSNIKTVATDWTVPVATAPLYVEKAFKVTASPNVAIVWGENNTAFYVSTGSAKGTGAVFGISTAGGSTSKCSAASLTAAPTKNDDITGAVKKVTMAADGTLVGCNAAGT